MKTSKPNAPVHPPIAEGDGFLSIGTPDTPPGYIKLGHLLYKLRVDLHGTDLDNKDIDQADEPLRQLLFSGGAIASFWANGEFKPIPAEKWDNATFVLQATSGWPTQHGIVVLEDTIADRLLTKSRPADAPLKSAFRPGFPISTYLQLMLDWSAQAETTDEPWTKKAIIHWLRANWPKAGEITENELNQMAGLCRDKEQRRGGNKKTGVIRSSPKKT